MSDLSSRPGYGRDRTAPASHPRPSRARPRPPRPRAKARKSLLLHGVLVLGVASTLLFENPSLTLGVGGILSFFVYAYLAALEGRRAPLWLTPLSFYFLWYSVGLGLSAVYFAVLVSGGSPVAFSIVRVPAEDIAVGYVLFLAGSFALHYGMQVTRPVMTAEMADEAWAKRRGRIEWLVLLWVVGLAYVGNSDLFAGLGAVASFLSRAPFAAVSVFAVTPRRYYGMSRHMYSSAMTIGVLSLLLSGLSSGSKAIIMYSFVPLAWMLIVRKPLRRYLPMLLGVLAVFYLALVAPVVTASRHHRQAPGQASVGHMVQAIRGWEFGVGDRSIASTFAVQGGNFLSRQFDSIPMGYFVGDVRDSGLKLGATMSYVWYAFIPRVLWPSKPNVTRGAWFTAYLGFSENEATATTSTGMTAAGELYWNFGVPGVLVGMFTIGLLVGGVWRMAGADPRGAPLKMLLYTILMLNMPNMPEAVTVLVGIVLYFVAFKSAFMISEIVPKRRQAVC